MHHWMIGYLCVAKTKIGFCMITKYILYIKVLIFFFMKKESIIEGEIDVRQLANHAGYVSYCAMP
jgi:hypothetical protein